MINLFKAIKLTYQGFSFVSSCFAAVELKMKLEYCTVWITLSSALPIYIVDVHLKTVNAMTLEAGVKIV